MPQTRTTAVAIRTDSAKAAALLQPAATALSRAGDWATNTAQEFGALVAALMGPAVLSAYSLAIWSLAASLGWTNTFLFTTGPLSNWLVWFAVAVSVNAAASILRRRTRQSS